MHYLTLVTVEIPELEENVQVNQEIEQKIESLKSTIKGSECSLITELFLEKLNSQRNTFSREVNYAVSEAMEPYAAETDNPDYLEFWDKTEELKKNYETENIDCFKLPEGRIVSAYNSILRGRFFIREGKVYERYAGPLKHEKHTKHAKRLKAIPNYPVKKLYPHSTDYAEDYCGCPFYNEQNGYGFYYNPNAFWDWYSIGGRWPELFLVKEDCTEFSVGESSPLSNSKTHTAPEGYKWVCAARKKDIAWHVLYEWELQHMKERFKKLEHFFITGEREESIHGQITGDGILCYGKLIYQKSTVYKRLHRLGN